MPSLNKVLLMGNLTRDPELKQLPGTERQVVDLGLAVNRKGKRADGSEWEDVLFVDVSYYGPTAETLHKYTRKGDPLYVEGRLKLSRWETSLGEKRSKIRVEGERFQFLPRSAPGPEEKSVSRSGIRAEETPF